MPVYPRTQQLTVREGTPLIVRARVTNEADEYLVNDAQAGRQCTKIVQTVTDLVANATVYSETLTNTAGVLTTGVTRTWTQSTKTITSSAALDFVGTVVGERVVIQSGTGMDESEVGSYIVATTDSNTTITLTEDCGATDAATDLLVLDPDIADFIPTLAQTLQTEGWSRDDRGWNFQAIIPPGWINATTPGHGGDWTPGKRYRYEARLVTDAVPGTVGTQQDEGDLYVVADVLAESIRAV